MLKCHRPPSMATGRWSKVDKHIQLLRQPHGQIIVAQVGLGCIALKQCDHVWV